MTFLQLLLAVEEAQSQWRAENGIEEIVIGYYGRDDDESEDALDQTEMNDLISKIGGDTMNVSVEDLPDDIRSVYLAEMHRLKTGEFKEAIEFSALREVKT